MRFWGDRSLPELLLGLLALAIAAVITGIVVADAIRDVRKRRDTITVTGSAREPIDADVATWRIAVRAQRADPAAASRVMRTQAAAVRRFLRDGGLTDAEVHQPPLSTADVLRRVGRRRVVQSTG